MLRQQRDRRQATTNTLALGARRPNSTNPNRPKEDPRAMEGGVLPALTPCWPLPGLGMRRPRWRAGRCPRWPPACA